MSTNNHNHEFGELLDIYKRLETNDWCFSDVPQNALRLYIRRRWWLNNEFELKDWCHAHNIKRIKIIHMHDHSDCMLYDCPDLETKTEFILRWT